MTKSVYSIRDNKMNSFGTPVLLENDSVAVRQFGDIITEGNTVMSKHPSDFTLYKIGEFDMESGKFTNLDCPSALATGSDFGIPKGE